MISKNRFNSALVKYALLPKSSPTTPAPKMPSLSTKPSLSTPPALPKPAAPSMTSLGKPPAGGASSLMPAQPKPMPALNQNNNSASMFAQQPSYQANATMAPSVTPPPANNASGSFLASPSAAPTTPPPPAAQPATTPTVTPETMDSMMGTSTAPPTTATPAPASTTVTPDAMDTMMGTSTAPTQPEQTSPAQTPTEQPPPATAAAPAQQKPDAAGQQQPAQATGSSSVNAHPEQQKANDTLMGQLNDPNLPDADKQKLAQQHVQKLVDSNPEMKQGMADLQAGKDTPQAKAFQAQVDNAGNAYIREEFGKLRAQNPNAGPQEQGSMMNSVMEGWNNMPTEMKWMMGLGVGGGLLGMLGSMFGGGGGMGLLGLLGLGVGGLAGAAGGMFGQGAQDALGGMVGQLGQATGMIPKDVDLSALKGEDAVQRATETAQGGGWSGAWNAFWDPEGEAKKVQGQLDQANQLQRLMMVPEGMRAGMLKQISPNSSPEEIQQMLTNANQMNAAMNDPNNPLAQGMQRGQQFTQDPRGFVNNEVYNYTLGNSYLPWNWGQDKASSARVQRLISGWANKSAFNAADQKELNDLEAWQMKTKKYDVEKVRRLKELQDRQAASYPPQDVVKICMKSARCWAGYEPVPGKAPYSEDSCRPIGSKKKKKKTEKKSASDDVGEWLKRYRARGLKGRWVNTRQGSSKAKKISNK